ncbi:MAG: ABC transporter permease [Caldilineaceae bacterium]|nr:ABC transporter permease [Caldilineaceae bacterium]MDE0069642.1 ABC transporter permease [Caldilineaceae bacterium]MDE0180458.1 ABC transporter permease [Caldilineaceae bacterium]
MAKEAAATDNLFEEHRSSTATPRARTWRRFRRHKMALAGAAFILLVVSLAALAPVITPHSPTDMQEGRARDAPTTEHLLGLDGAARDIWARLLYGGRVSLSVGIVAVSISVLIALILGTLSGYYGGTVDMIIMRFTDVMMVFPGLILIMTVVAVLGPNIWNVMAVIGLLGWPSSARLVRGQILSVREWDFVMAARCLGVEDQRIMFRHILPHVLAPLLVAATFGVASAILTEAGLSFLGLGVLPPTPSWGNMLTGAQSIYILERFWWMWLPPGIAILFTVLAINFVGDGLRDAFDPRMTLD